MENEKIIFLFLFLFFCLGATAYLTGASNIRKRSRDSTVVQPLDDDAEFEDACEKSNEKKLKAY